MTISKEEARSRSESWASAIASMELEGLKFPDCGRELVEQYISGDLDSEQLTAALHELCGIPR